VSRAGLRISPGVWVVTLCLAAGLSACGAARHSNVATRSGHSEVTTEPVSTAGTNRFTLPAGTDLPGLGPVSGVLRSPSGGGSPTYWGDRPGLYAGTRGRPSCDVGKLSTLLQQNPHGAAAWASTLGIQPSQIPSYLASLTSVLLRTDTRVTNHGFVNGVATSLQAVLQAGTAVVVDKYGQPVAKCYCGNPLTPPVLSSRETYKGPEWSGFSIHRIAVIQRSKKIINTFTLYDPNGDHMFQRKAGTNIASSDGAFAGPTTTSTSSTAEQPPSTSSTAEQPPTTTTTASQTP